MFECFGLPRKNGHKSLGRIQLGDYSYAHKDAYVKCWKSPCVVRTGKYCSLAKCKFVYDGNHNTKFASTFPFLELGHSKVAPANAMLKDEPMVGHDVWIADDAVIYSGVVVGNGAIVAGQAVVTKDVPPYAIVAGNPGKVVRYRFPSRTIERLQKVQWWHLPHDFICESLAPVIDNIDEFLKRAEAFREKNGTAL
jgi:acetyltransferase-like isoleucine patch superfamily enzyme